jgi:predicted alpha/beta superfamily hydrolase
MKKNDLHYPVLYVLDANALFGMTTEMLRIFNMLQVIRDVIVVGIGYPVDTFLATGGFRTRDCTPTEIDGWYDANFKPYYVGAPDDAGTGGAAKFLQFIREELMPMIDATYRTVHGDNGIVGHSFTGLFALYALLNGTDIFKRYLIGSPSIEWDKGVILDSVKIFAANKADVTARVFMSVGAEEGPTMNNMKKVSELLHQNLSPQLHVISQIFEGEIHPSVIPAHISRGIREVYGGG